VPDGVFLHLEYEGAGGMVPLGGQAAVFPAQPSGSDTRPRLAESPSPKGGQIVNLLRIKEAGEFARELGGVVGEFEALFAAVSTAKLFTTSEEFKEIWTWYIERLLELQCEMQGKLQRRGIPYRIELFDPLKIALGKIQAILMVSHKEVSTSV